MKQAIMRMLRQTKAGAVQFTPEKKPILIFGLRRGGSTMVADAVAVNKGVWYTNEPFAVLPKHPGYETRKAALPEAMHSHFFELEGQDLERFAAYTDDHLHATYRDQGTARRAGMPPKANRVCLKILNAPWMLPWFADQITAHAIALLRHPGGQVTSTLRQNWGFPLEAYVQRPNDMALHFAPDEIASIAEALERGDRWEIGVLDWVVQAVPLMKAEAHGVPLVTYEDVVRDPEAFVDDWLCGTCGLEDRAAMIATFGKPSGSSRLSTDSVNNLISAGDRDAVVERWRKDVTDEQLRVGQDILDRFCIDLYRFVD